MTRRPASRSSGQTIDRCAATCKLKLRRNTFLPGEQLCGTVTFAVADADQDCVDIEEATVQAHGYVKVDPRWISLPGPLRSLFNQESDADAQGLRMPRYSGLDDDKSACIFASDVALLLKKERLQRGEAASFAFSLVLPAKLVPTFKGIGLRYAYAVTVRITRPSPAPAISTRLLGLVRRRPAAAAAVSLLTTTDLHVAFTVLSEGSVSVPSHLFHVGDTAEGAVESGKIGESEDNWGEVELAELDVERQSREAFTLEAARAKAGGLVSGTRAVTWNMQGRMFDDGSGSIAASALLGAPGGGVDPGGVDPGGTEVPAPPAVYSIRNGDNRVGTFVLHKAEFCAGDIVLGNFDFSTATMRCLQVCACLEVSEENIFYDPAATANGGKRTPVPGKSTSHKRVVDASKELTPCVLQSSIALSLPMDAPVSFSTALVIVSWTLRFEFVISAPESSPTTQGSTASRPAHSVLQWAVPVKVVPPRRMVLAGGRSVGGRELSYNAMDATGRSILC